MSTILKKLTMTNTPRSSFIPNQTQCNYANNDYGDQVCVEVKRTISSEVNSLASQSGAA